jgi:hypothetical protein
MRFVVLTVLMLGLVSMLGCLGPSGPPIQWSRNIAPFAECQDPKLNDDNIHSVGETSRLIIERTTRLSRADQEEEENFTQATLRWAKPQPIQRIVVIADKGKLEFFEVQVVDESGDWKTIRSVKNHYQDQFKLQLPEPIHTHRLRLKVPKKWESRRVGGQKRRTRGEGGREVDIFKPIRDVQVYYALPPEEQPAQPATEQ